MREVYLTLALQLLVLLTVHGQVINTSDSVLMKYVAPAPGSIFNRFREAGMNPTNHVLTKAERGKVEAAFSALPVLHQRILSNHLHSISFMDNMPNTALTSPVVSPDSVKRFNITFRAGIFHETISEWASKKENTIYDKTGSGEYTVTIEAGQLDAFLYVLLHEATHVVDVVMKLTPPVKNAGDNAVATDITKGVWEKLNVPVEPYIDSIVEKSLFRGGGRVPIARAPELYRALSGMPFVSLYGTASWSEDIAELETIYHLTHKLKQPFYVVVKKGEDEVVRFEPMKGKLVQARLNHLEVFYR